MDIQGPGLRFRAQTPDPVQKNISGHNIPFIFHQKKQKLVLLIGKGDFCILHKHFVSFRVDPQDSVLKNILLAGCGLCRRESVFGCSCRQLLR